MKILLRNFGPISEFEFDLNKDLNMIFGKNNIGKSYAISAIYLILKNMMGQVAERNSVLLELFYMRNRGLVFEDESNYLFQELDNALDLIVKNITSSSDKELDVTTDIEIILLKILNNSFIDDLEQSFNNSFDSIEKLNNQFKKGGRFEIKIFFNEYSVIITSKSKNLIVKSVSLNSKIILRKIKSNRKNKIDDGQTTIYFNESSKSISNKSNSFLQTTVKIYTSSRLEINNLIKNVYFLPASRSGLYQALSTFSAVIAELSKSRNFLSNKIELPDISEPVSDYFLYLSKISKVESTGSLMGIANEIETLILDGEIKLNQKTKKIVFSPNKIDYELDLSVASSMISEIAPIVAYLKYVIDVDSSEKNASYPGVFMRRRTRSKTSKNLIFIEEPEAHLHPEIQVKLMEMFVNLLGHNVKLVMTSHSNYMFNKLSNLLLSKSIKPEIVGSYLMRMENDKGSVADAFLMKAENDGIDDQNFVDIAEQLYNERLDIYNSL